MSMERNGALYVRTHTEEELKKAIKIAKKNDINLHTHYDGDGLSAFAEEFYPDTLSETVFDITEKVPNCLILYMDNTVYYGVNMHSYTVAIKYPSEIDEDYLICEDDTEKPCPILLGNYQTPEGVFREIKASGNKLKAKYKAEILEIFGREVNDAILGAKNVVIENGKKEIEDGEFEGMEMQTVEIPDSVKKIGANAFANCEKLKTVVIPSSVKEIGAEAFANCTKLTKVVIEEGVGKIGDSAFAGCTKLTTVVLPKKLSRLGKCAFQDCKALESITVPKGITKINNYVFENCSALQKVEFLDTIVGIGIRAFARCKSLVDFEIPSTVPADKIGRAAFYQAKVKKPKNAPGDVEQTLEGLTFVVTGDLENFPEKTAYPKRTKLKEFIEARGGRLTSSVSRRTSYLICNPTPYVSAKMQAALDNDIPIIIEEDFMAMAEGKKLKL